MKLDNDAILNIVRQELSQAATFGSRSPNSGSGSVSDIETPLEYYLGLPNGTEVEGRSQIMSTDVADAIEWILPQIMKALTSTNEVVVFDPTGPEDELQAELETEYVFDTLMKRNNGFVVLHQCVKDALMQRNGLIKVYYKSYEDVTTSTYSGLTADQLNMLIAAPGVEVIEYSQTQDISAKLSITKQCSKICVESVALENFKMAADHNSIDLSECRFTTHSVVKTLSDLREEGVDEKLIAQLTQAYQLNSNYRFEAQGETTNTYLATNDESQMPVYIEECYMHMDVDGDGIAEFVKVTVGGDTQPHVVLSVEPIDASPWVSTTAILMSHKFQGLSVYDRLKQIQDHRTAIWRSVLDNMYLQNNQRNIVLENQVNLDDMLVSRPGGIIRVKRMDSIMPLVTPPLSDVSIQMLQMLDETKAGRVGVSADGATAPQNLGDRVGSQGVNQLMTAKEELVGLIVRVIAETGMKPLCVKIRDLARQHVDTIDNLKFKGQWVQVNPTSWQTRSSCTVRVGTGSGDKTAKTQAIQTVMQLQATLGQTPMNYLVSDMKVYSAIDDYCKFSGLNGAAKYLLDPQSDEGMQAKQIAQQTQQEQAQKTAQQQMAMLEIESKLVQAELQKSQAQMDNVTLKGQVEMAKHQRELMQQEFEAKIADMEAKLTQMEMLANASEKDSETQFKYAELDHKAFIELTKVNAQKDLKLLEISAAAQQTPPPAKEVVQ